MSIAAKEARETKYWLRLLDKSNLTQLDCKTHLEGIEHILNILSKIILTSKNSLDKK
jgi:four helix bundle protein